MSNDKVKLTFPQLKSYKELAERYGNERAFADLVLEWAELAQAHMDRLQQDLSDARAEIESLRKVTTDLMSTRDQFAAQVMAALHTRHPNHFERLATEAYRLADAMMKERAQ